MHCSATSGRRAIRRSSSASPAPARHAFGDPSRSLIGDDEHGWSENGVFNFEDGCYAKVIRLSPEAEPQIHACTRRFGTILENVVVDPLSRRLDLNDDLLTENTRGAIRWITSRIICAQDGRPSRNVVFLTAMPAVSCRPSRASLPTGHLPLHFRLHQQDRGTEIGLGKEPEITFSTCFGGPFMVHRPYAYAEMLKARLLKYGAVCWLVNTAGPADRSASASASASGTPARF